MVPLTTLYVLRVFMDDPGQDHYGLEIGKAAGLKSGSIYPALAWLEREGWVTSGWEQINEHDAGRRRRRYYRLTQDGAVLGQEVIAVLLERLSPQPGPG